MLLKHINHIAFDIDGVMTDLDQDDFIMKSVNEFLSLKGDLKNYRLESSNYLWRDKFPDMPKDYALELEGFMLIKLNRFSPVMANVPMIIRYLLSLGIEISSITARDAKYVPSDYGYTNDQIKADTEAWFRQKMIHFDYSKIHYSADNKIAIMNEIGADILVDDNPGNIYSVAKEKPVIVVPQPWNMDVKGDNIYRLKSKGKINIREFISMLEIIDANLITQGGN